MTLKQVDPLSKDEELDLETLYRRHGQTVARWARRLAGPSCDIEDLVHEVFLIAQRKLPGFRGEAKITTWLYRVTENVVRHQRRKDRWRRWLGGSANEVGDLVASSRPTPVEELERRQASELVYRILDGMNERYRTLVILFEIEGTPAEEIAELMGMKIGTLWVALHRARAQFLSRLEKQERT